MAGTLVLELDDLLGRYAWKQLHKRSNFLRKMFLTESEYYPEVDWKAMNIEHNIMKFSLRPENKTFDTSWGKLVTGSKWIPLYACDFENQTETKQVHTFRGRRETTTWIAVELRQCYTVGKTVDVDVNLPTSFVKFRAGRDNTMNVSKMKGEVFKEIVSWEVNSQIEVSPSWKAHAELLAREECHAIDFEIRTNLFVPKGKLPVYFKKKSDDKIAYLVEVDDFQEAFRTKENGGVLEEEEMDIVQMLMETTIDEDGKEQSCTKIQLVTQGTCTSVTWSDQKVDIKTEPLRQTENNRKEVIVDRNDGLKE